MLTAQTMRLMDDAQLLRAAHAEIDALTSTPLELELLLRRLEEAMRRALSAAQAADAITSLDEALAGLPGEDFLEEAIAAARLMSSTERGRTSLADLRGEAETLAQKLEAQQEEITGQADYARECIAEVQNLLTPTRSKP